MCPLYIALRDPSKLLWTHQAQIEMRNGFKDSINTLTQSWKNKNVFNALLKTSNNDKEERE